MSHQIGLDLPTAAPPCRFHDKIREIGLGTEEFSPFFFQKKNCFWGDQDLGLGFSENRAQDTARVRGDCIEKCAAQEEM